MTTTLIAHFDDTTKLEKAIAFFKTLQIPFNNYPSTLLDDEETAKTHWIQSQLSKKYVKTGEWDTMDDEERQDAALLEMMLYTEDQPDFETISFDESEAFLNQLRQGAL